MTYKCPRCCAPLSDPAIAAWVISLCPECQCRYQMVNVEGSPDPTAIIPQWLADETVACDAGLGAFIGEAGGASNQEWCQVFHRAGCVETPIVEIPPPPAQYFDCG